MFQKTSLGEPSLCVFGWIDVESSLEEMKQRDREEREELWMWKKPVLTLRYFFLELLVILRGWMGRLWQHRQTALGLLILLILLFIAYCIDGAHQKYVRYVEKKTLWCAYWAGLGILSSVGLGTGLHTFLLYLVRLSVRFSVELCPVLVSACFGVRQ
uniref:Vacuole membrane protein 1 n=1 Tax=Oryzias melastigma TaxID=30732 RepID=A0A3B3DDI4_ORYME